MNICIFSSYELIHSAAMKIIVHVFKCTYICIPIRVHLRVELQGVCIYWIHSCSTSVNIAESLPNFTLVPIILLPLV